MPKPNMREQLIASTQELLWDRGYAATSPKAILNRAGAGQGSMYHHFSGKEQLAAEALAVTSRRLIEQTKGVLQVPGTAQDRLEAYLLRQRKVLRGCPIGRMAADPDVLDSPALHDLLTRTFDEIRKVVTAVVADGIAAGDFDADTEPSHLAETVLAVVQGGYVLARAAGNPAPFDRAVKGAAALLTHTRKRKL